VAGCIRLLPVAAHYNDLPSNALTSPARRSHAGQKLVVADSRLRPGIWPLGQSPWYVICVTACSVILHVLAQSSNFRTSLQTLKHGHHVIQRPNIEQASTRFCIKVYCTSVLLLIVIFVAILKDERKIEGIKRKPATQIRLSFICTTAG